METKGKIQDVYGLTALQEGLLFHALYERKKSLYVEQMSFIVQGIVDVPVLEASLGDLFQRHDILRTTFIHENVNRTVQVVMRQRRAPLHFEDISSLADEDRIRFLSNFRETQVATGFDLTSDALLKFALIKTSRDTCELIWCWHHILADGWCIQILLRELVELYAARLHKRPANLPPVTPFSEYVKWVARKNPVEPAEYWKGLLAGFTRPTGLCFKNEGQLEKTIKNYTIDCAKTGRIRHLLQKNKVTANCFFRTAWGLILGIYHQTGDVVFGAVVSNRPAEIPGVENMVGLFVNTLPVRLKLEPQLPFEDLLQQVQGDLAASDNYSYFSLAEIQSLSPLKSALFDHIITYQNYPALGENSNANGSLGPLAISAGEFYEESHYGLDVVIREGSDVIDIAFRYDRKAVHDETVEMIIALFNVILDRALDNDRITVHGLCDLTTLDTTHPYFVPAKSLAEQRGNDRFRPHMTLTASFEEQVLKTPYATALVFGDLHLSFEELNTRANALAHHFMSAYQLRVNDLVAISLVPGDVMITAILAVLKCGGAYVPVDPNFPSARIDRILSDGNCRFLFDTDAYDAYRLAEREYSRQPVISKAQPTDIAYVIFTSGSTGQPKGCVLQHNGVVNRIEWMWQHYGFDASDVILQKTTFTFDVSVWEIFMPLCWGARMVILPQDDIASPVSIRAKIRSEKVTCLHFVPSMLSAFVTDTFDDGDISLDLKTVNRLFTSGEALTSALLNRWYHKVQIPVTNLYGPTEASIEVTYYATSVGDRTVPIGRPIWNTYIHIIGESGQILPRGAVGEICIGGIALSRGYLNNIELTNARFVNDPLTRNMKIYRTGDRGRWLPDGNIEYLGREDEQVKIHGYRIELGEIENTLLQLSWISQTVVITKVGEDEELELVAYVVANLDDKDVDGVHEIRNYLARSLPAYMIPTYIVLVDKLKQTSSGKIDKLALLPPSTRGRLAANYVPPQTQMQKEMAAIWSQILNVETIGIYDNFFQLGGHSLKAIRLLSMVSKKMNFRLHIRTVFDHPTIAAFCEEVEAIRWVNTANSTEHNNNVGEIII